MVPRIICGTNGTVKTNVVVAISLEVPAELQTKMMSGSYYDEIYTQKGTIHNF